LTPTSGLDLVMGESATTVTDQAAPAPGLQALRPPPDGLPAVDLAPPVIAEPGDPFAGLRIVDLLARIERGRPILVADIVDRLNAMYVDWLFSPRVVTDVAIALQANWMADYRNASGIGIEDSAYGATIEIEDSTRVDPWIVGQARRQALACRASLAEFARRERITGEG
jgi:hypothetical protein